MLALPVAEQQRQRQTSSTGIKQQLLTATWADDELLTSLEETATSESVTDTSPNATDGKSSRNPAQKMPLIWEGRDQCL